MLHAISHRFQYITVIAQLFDVDIGCLFFITLVSGEPLNSVLRNLASRNYSVSQKK